MDRSLFVEEASEKRLKSGITTSRLDAAGPCLVGAEFLVEGTSAEGASILCVERLSLRR